MLTKNKKLKLLSSLKSYNKKFLSGKMMELDESGTRLMINSFLTDVLGFIPIDEVKTEYMIRGTYADYVVQTKGDRRFLVEVKSLSLTLSDKHLRQAINYGANEGIEWALLTNGKQFNFYKILFEKPINSRLVFSLDLCDSSNLKNCIDTVQFLHREAVLSRGLDELWHKTIALDPINVSGLLYANPVVNFLKRTLNKKYRSKFNDDEIKIAIGRIIHDQIELDDVKQVKSRKSKRKSIVAKSKKETAQLVNNGIQPTGITP